MKNNGRLIFGSVLIFLGIVFFLDQFGFLNQIGTSSWFVLSLMWPLLLIYFGYRIYSNSSSYWGIFLIVIGCISLLDKFVDVNFWSIVWPLSIIGVGIYILLKKEDEKLNKSETSVSAEDSIHEDIVFWGIDRMISSNEFVGGEVNCIFGGGKLDLSEAKISKDGAELDVNCIFGGLEVIVPEDCKIISDGTGVFGGWDVKTKDSKTGPTLRISGSAVFGGVEVKR